MRSAVLATVLLAAAPAAAQASIVPGRSIAGVRLGALSTTTLQTVGAPERVVRQEHPLIGETYRWIWGKRRLAMSVSPSGRILDVLTRDPGERTSRGVGVGSTRRQVDERVKGSTCERRLCRTGRLAPGARVTTFRLREGRVTEVSIGIVID